MGLACAHGQLLAQLPAAKPQDLGLEAKWPCTPLPQKKANSWACQQAALRYSLQLTPLPREDSLPPAQLVRHFVTSYTDLLPEAYLLASAWQPKQQAHALVLIRPAGQATNPSPDEAQRQRLAHQIWVHSYSGTRYLAVATVAQPALRPDVAAEEAYFRALGLIP